MKFIAAILTSIALVACAAKTSNSGFLGGTTTEANPTDGSQSKTQLAGTYVKCTTAPAGAGPTLSGLAYLIVYTLSSDGTYSYGLRISNSTACSTSTTVSGNIIISYLQSGSFVVNGTNTTPSTSTKVEFTPSSAFLTIRDATYSSQTTVDFINWANNNCTPVGGFSAGQDDSKTFLSKTCTADASTVNLTGPPTATTAYKGIMYNDGTNLNVDSRQSPWHPTSGVYGSSYTETFVRQ